MTDVDVWRVDLDFPPAGAVPVEEELERSARLRDGVDRAWFLASRAWLRAVLAGYLAVDAAAIRFDRAERGKPAVVDGGDVCFSLSRSAGVGLIAVTRGRAVGVDIEQIRSGFDHQGMAKQFFAPAESASLQDQPESDREHAFFRLWVRKEAVLKASGAGLGDGMGHLDARNDMVDDRWSVASIDVGPGWAAAVAVDGAMGPIHLPEATVRGGARGGRGRR